MNELIKELAVQAMTATTNKFSADREWSADEWRDFYDTKFAEWIVKECAEIGDGYDNETKYNQGLIDIQTAGDEIRKHFGVEE